MHKGIGAVVLGLLFAVGCGAKDTGGSKDTSGGAAGEAAGKVGEAVDKAGEAAGKAGEAAGRAGEAAGAAGEAAGRAGEAAGRAAEAAALGAAAGAEGMAAGAEAMKAGLAAAGAAGGDFSKVPVANWRDVIKALPDEVDGMKGGEAKGETVTMGAFKVTNVENRYKAGDKSIEIKIVDTSANPMFMGAFAAPVVMEIDTTDEFMKKTEIGGSPAYVNVKHKTGRAEVTLLYKGRFLVSIEAEGYKDFEAAKKLAAAVKLAELDAAMEKAKPAAH